MNLNKKSSALRVNVGFLLNETVGYSREIEFDHPVVCVGEDLTLHDLRGRVRLTRTAQGLYGQGELTAHTPTECVRCLAEFSQTLSLRIDELFVYPPVNATDPLLVVSDDMHINLAPLVREYMLLDMPLQPICRPDCKGLCPQCGEDRNQVACGCEDERIDPRLAALKSLLRD